MLNDYLEYAKEHLEWFGPIKFKKMFGGFGVYSHNMCIGVVIENELYLKGDDVSIAIYSNYESSQFAYTHHKSKQEIKMNWWKVTDEIFDNKSLLNTCYHSALSSAKSAQTKTTKKQRRD